MRLSATRLSATRLIPILVVAALVAAPAALRAQTPAPANTAPAAKSPYTGTTLEGMIPPGNNFDIAQFRLWYPDNVSMLRGIVLLVPGSNGDGRASAQDTVWQAFAVKHKLALVACYFKDKQHDQNFIEDYIKVADGSGEFVAWKPERVIAFVVNKGGIYYSALVPRAARSVPGVLFVGGKDLEFRTNTIVGLFAVNRRAGALWALSEEPGAAHIVGRSRDLAIPFYEDVMAARLPAATGPLKPMPEKPAFIGDFKTKSFAPTGTGAAPGFPTAWLPTERIARVWQAILTEQPFPPNL